MFDFVSFIPRAIVQGIPLLFGSTGETLTEKSGNLNLGIPGIMYVGGICGVIGAFLYEHAVPAPGALNPFLAILIPLLSSLLGSLLMGLLYCFLTVTLRANQNVTGLAMTTFGVGFGNLLRRLAHQALRRGCPLHCSFAHERLFQRIAPVFRQARLVRQDFPLLRFPCLRRRYYCVYLRLYPAPHAHRPPASCRGRKPQYGGRGGHQRHKI